MSRDDDGLVFSQLRRSPGGRAPSCLRPGRVVERAKGSPVTIQRRIRVLGLTAALGLAMVADPGGLAHAVGKNPHPKTASQCLAQGYPWDDVKGCADKSCSHNGMTYGHGAVISAQDPDNGFPMRCDGFTGTWKPYGTIRPGGPSHPTAPP